MHLIENSLGEFYKKQVALDPDHEFVVYPDRKPAFYLRAVRRKS